MKILHINSYYSKGKFYKNLYDLQIFNKKDIQVYVPVEKNFISSFDFGKYTEISKVFNKKDRIFFHLKHYKILKDCVYRFGRFKFDIVHAHSLFSNGYVAMKLKEKFNIPYIVAIRNTDVNIFFKRMIHLRKLGIKIIRNANKVVFLSNSYRDYVIENYIPTNLKESVYNKSIVISNGIDDFWIKEKGKPKELNDENKIKLIFVGSIDKNKNVLSVIKASEILIKDNIEVELSVIGKPEDKNIMRIIRNKAFVKYYDYMSKDDLKLHYSNSDIFVMPSKYETFGLVYAEAMSQGLPLIYTKGQGFDGYFEDGTVGYSVESDNIEDIVLKIKKVINNYNEISFNSIKYTAVFKWEYQEKKYSLLYDEILRGNNDYNEKTIYST